MRTILLHVDDDASLEARMQCALSLARATSGHVTCVHATPVEAYVAFDSFGGVFVMEKIMEAIGEQEAAVKARVEAKFRSEDVSWDYSQATGSIPQVLLSYGALADIIISGRKRDSGKARGAGLGQLGDIVMKSRVPVLIPGDGAKFDPSGKAVIAWNDSYEAANAVRSSLPLLKLAASVEILRFDEPAKQADERFPSTRLLEYLSRHDIHADLKVDTIESGFVGEALVASAVDGGASHMILGGYGHSRISEYLFGGVTRALLEFSPINLVIAH
jgi:nucleotide-binding universal stress UspA family protein